MRTESLALDLTPHVSRLYRDHSCAFEKVASYYSHPPFDRTWFSAQQQSVMVDHPQSRRQAVCKVLTRQNARWSAGNEVSSNLAKLGSGAMAVVTGQQVSLFGGPLFSLLKALTAIKLAKEATQSGIECVPIFWMATEDHDVAEVSSFQYRIDGGLRTLSLAPQIVEGAPVATATLPNDVTGLIRRLADDLGDSEIIEVLRGCYLPGAPMGDAFARLLSRLFARYGMILMDPFDVKLHSISAPFFRKTIESAEASAGELLQRTKELEGSGYLAQVKVTATSTNLFRNRNGKRHPIQRNSGGFSAGGEKFSASELLKTAESAPEDLSAGALLRPVFQDFLLPTLAYVGGPAEIAYFAQSEVLYRKLLGRVTPIIPRLSATLIEKNVERRLERYGLRLPDIFGSSQQIRQMLADRNLPQGLSLQMDGTRDQIDSLTASLEKSIEQLDPTLVDAARRAGSKMRYQVERLRRRVGNAQAVKELAVGNAAELLSAALYPRGALQERILGGTYFLARQGLGLIDEMFESLASSGPQHQILYP